MHKFSALCTKIYQLHDKGANKVLSVPARQLRAEPHVHVMQRGFHLSKRFGNRRHGSLHTQLDMTTMLRVIDAWQAEDSNLGVT